MIHILIGIVAIVIGLRGIVTNWYMFRDVFLAVLPLVLIGFGVVALLAGIRGMKEN